MTTPRDDFFIFMMALGCLLTGPIALIIIGFVWLCTEPKKKEKV